MRCAFCDKPAIVTSGNSYCEDHVGYRDVLFFEIALDGIVKDYKEFKEFCRSAFGTMYPKLSDLAKWHDRIPRPERENQHRRIYEEEQASYIRKIFEYYKESK